MWKGEVMGLEIVAFLLARVVGEGLRSRLGGAGHEWHKRNERKV